MLRPDVGQSPGSAALKIHNREIAAIFEELADLLEVEGANRFRVRAYREASRVIGGMSEDLADLVESGADLTELPNIGEAIAKKIQTIVETGSLPQLTEVEGRTPASLSEMMKLEGLGPKRVKALHEQLGIDTLDDLRAAVEAHKVRQLEGFGQKTEETIRERLEHWQGQERRTRLFDAEEIADPLVRFLKAIDGVEQVMVAGSYRRRRETVGDLDILVTCRRDTPVMDRFVAYPEVSELVSKGETRSTVHLRSGMQVDLRLVPEASYGAALHYFTGSKAHNIAVRRLGVKQGLKINEYGVFRDDKPVAGRTEEQVYASVDLPSSAGAAGGPRRDRGRPGGQAAAAGEARGHPRRPACPHEGKRRPRQPARHGRCGGRARLRISGHH